MHESVLEGACRDCAAPVGQDWIFCPSCGLVLVEVTDD
jgi:RNA polymerase subunit RPABC4/transcription elongation factor Spt4